jgi:AcrR family transcriptional regulator
MVRQSQQYQSKCFIEAGARTMLSSREETAKLPADGFRREQFRQVHELHRSGISIRKIGQRLKMSRMTVYRYLRYEEFPERAPARERGSRLGPYLRYIHQRYAEGCHNATQLWREVVERGYAGRPAMVRRYVRNLRKRTSEITSEKLKTKELKESFATPSARKTTILLLKKEDHLKAEEKTFVQTVVSIDQELEKVRSLGAEFQAMLRKQQSEKFTDWLETAAKCGISEMMGFAWGLKQDKEAVTEAMQSKWSQGQVEGQVNRLKMLKRQMYGRASFELLRARVLNRN